MTATIQQMTDRTPATDFLIRLHNIDAAHLVGRDVLILWMIQTQPCITGMNIARKLGLASRSMVQDNLRRIQKYGLAEDRRVADGRFTPNQFYITEAGKEFLYKVIPSL